jgi:hypothetical protein
MTTELEFEIFQDLKVRASGPEQISFLKSEFKSRAVHKF